MDPWLQGLLTATIIPAIFGGVAYFCRDVKGYLNEIMAERHKFLDYVIEKEIRATEERKMLAELFASVRDEMREQRQDFREHTDISKVMSSQMAKLVYEVEATRETLLQTGKKL